MSESGIPAVRNWAAKSSATRCVSPRLWTLGISIACLNTSRVFACHSGASGVGTVRGSTAAVAAVESAAAVARAMKRIIVGTPLFAGEVAQHDLPMDNIVVQRLHGQALVLAVGAIVDRGHCPAAVGAVDWDAGHAERPSVARAGRHFRENGIAGMQRLEIG